MRIFSYLYHALLALFLLLLALLTAVSPNTRLHLDMVPWNGAGLGWVLFVMGLFGLVSILLAINGTIRFLFFAWSVIVAVLMLKGFFFSSHFFGRGELAPALYLTGGALIAVAGAWFQFRSQTPKERWKKSRG